MGDALVSLSQGAVLRLAEIIAAIGVFISTAEYLATWRDLRRGQISDWRVLRSRPATYSDRSFQPLLDRLLDLPGYVVVLAVRLLAISTLFLPLDARAEVVALVVIVATTLLITYRNSFGQDGSDQMSSIVFVSILVARLGARDPRVGALAIWFIAVQSCASYCIAGLAKVAGRKWQNGEALFLIFNTQSYGMRSVAAFLLRHRALAKALTWSVVLIECAFPLALLAGPKVCLVFLAWGVAFHAANAIIMGLNSFFWAFLATYPCIFYCAMQIYRR